MTEPQVQATALEVGQPFNPFGLFTGIFIPDALVRSTAVSAGATLTYGRFSALRRTRREMLSGSAHVGFGNRRVGAADAELPGGVGGPETHQARAPLCRARSNEQCLSVSVAQAAGGGGEENCTGGGEESCTGGGEESCTQRESD